MFRIKVHLCKFLFLAVGLSYGIHVKGQIAASQSSRNAINGQVTDSQRAPLPNLWVELLDEVDSVIMRLKTDNTGNYSFRNLSFGNFQVRVLTYGTNYQGQIVRVTLFPSTTRGTGAHYEQIDFVLRLKESRQNQTGTRTMFVQVVPPAAKKAFDQALNLLETEKKVTQGMEKLTAAIELFPTYYLALERLGLESLKAGQTDAAESAFKRALDVNPSAAASLYGLGFIHYQKQNWAAATDALQRSLTLNPDSPNAPFTHFYLGVALLKTNHPDDGIQHLKKAVVLGDSSLPADVHLHLAQQYSNQKQYELAADELESFLKQVPDARDAKNIKTIIRQLRGKANEKQHFNFTS